VFIGVAIPGDSKAQIDTFKSNYGIEFDIWSDINSNFQELVPPGGRMFPLEVVIDQEGKIRYLENDYVKGEAVKVVQDLLK